MYTRLEWENRQWTSIAQAEKCIPSASYTSRIACVIWKRGKEGKGEGGWGFFYNHNECSEHCAKQFPPSMSAKRKVYGCKTNLQRNLRNCGKLGGDMTTFRALSLNMYNSVLREERYKIVFFYVGCAFVCFSTSNRKVTTSLHYYKLPKPLPTVYNVRGMCLNKKTPFCIFRMHDFSS